MKRRARVRHPRRTARSLVEKARQDAVEACGNFVVDHLCISDVQPVDIMTGLMGRYGSGWPITAPTLAGEVYTPGVAVMLSGREIHFDLLYDADRRRIGTILTEEQIAQLTTIGPDAVLYLSPREPEPDTSVFDNPPNTNLELLRELAEQAKVLRGRFR